MKKTISVILIFALTLCFASCSASKAAKACDELILAIGEVSADSAEKISAAKTAYDKLSDEEKAEVKNAAKLTEAENKYAQDIITTEIAEFLNSDYQNEAKHKDYNKYLALGDKIAKECDSLSAEAKALLTDYDKFAESYAVYKTVRDDAYKAAKVYVETFEGHFNLGRENIKNLYCIKLDFNDENYFSFTCEYTDADGNNALCYANGSCKCTISAEQLLASSSIDSFFAPSAVIGYDGVNDSNLTLDLAKVLDNAPAQETTAADNGTTAEATTAAETTVTPDTSAQ